MKTTPQAAGGPVFATTRWSLVLNAALENSPEADHALAELCRVYWYPLYAYVRRFGRDPHTSQDLTQEFFARLLQKNYIGTADRKRGKFRWFLLTAFKCFLANEWDRERALKRGGAQTVLSLDSMSAEERYLLEPEESLTADQLYDRRWALDLLERARARLRADHTSTEKARRLELLEQYLPGEAPRLSQAEAATQLGMTENAVKQEVHRLKKRFGEVLRQEISQTVAHPDEVEEELRYLVDVLCRVS